MFLATGFDSVLVSAIRLFYFRHQIFRRIKLTQQYQKIFRRIELTEQYQRNRETFHPFQLISGTFQAYVLKFY